VAVGGGSLAGALDSSFSTGGGSIRTARGRDGRRRSMRYAEVAAANPWVRAAVVIRSSVGSRVPLHVFVPTIDDKGRRVPQRVRPGDGGEGAQLAALLKHPGPRLSGRRWRRRLLSDVLVHGNALVEEVTRGGRLVELAWQPWVDVKPHPSKDRLRQEAYEVPVERREGSFLLGRTQPGETRMLDRDEVIHLVADDELTVKHGPLGVSPLESLHYTHALHDAAMRFAVAYLDNGIFPSGVVEADPKASPAAVQATRELLTAIHSRVENAGQPLVIAGKWAQVSATPEAAKLVELARWSREEVAAAYGLTLQQLGDQGNSNKATAQVGREGFIRDVVGGDVAVLESEFNAQLVASHRRWSAAGLWIEGQLAEQLRPDLEKRSVIYARAGRWLTPNEVRELENRPPSNDPRADELTFDPGTPVSEDLDDSGDDEDDDVDGDL
jgi:HK97 family phage portal protein